MHFFGQVSTSKNQQATDKDKNNQIFNQLDLKEQERYGRCNKCKISEKHIKHIVNRVIGHDVHINKTMLKVIGGIAKCYVGQLVEEAKEIQLKEDYRLREISGLNEKLRKKRERKLKRKLKEEEDAIKKEGVKEEIKDKENEEKDEKDSLDSIPDIVNEVKEGEDFEEILKKTIYFEDAIKPEHLKLAREKYEKKRKKFQMKFL